MTDRTGRSGRLLAGGVAPLLLGGLAFALLGRGEAQSVPPVLSQAPAPLSAPPAPAPLPVATAEVIARYPHDARAFTQGLIWHRGRLYESTGQPGRSDVRRVRLETGAVEASTRLPARQFGEGLALSRGELVSLTWQDGIGHRWDPATLRRRGGFTYAGEGWGLTSDGQRLILSDGTAALRFLDPQDFRETGRVTVTLGGRPLGQLNELEWIDGEVWANVWHSNHIVRIDPESGRVTGAIDLRALVAEVDAPDPEAVLNGIAYDPATRRIFVTGKYWPTLFEIRVNAAR